MIEKDERHRVCPVSRGRFLLNPWRWLRQNPYRLLSPYVKEGMKVLDLGCGMGFFSLPMAKMVGKGGKVVCVDLQEGMLKGLRKRANKAGVAATIEARLCSENSLSIDDIEQGIDFALTFGVVHEVPDAADFFAQVHKALLPGAKLLIAEPRHRVDKNEFEQELAAALQQGFRVVSRPKVSKAYAALIERQTEYY